MIKKLVFTGGTNNLNTRHNKAMAHMNMMNLYQDKFPGHTGILGPIQGYDEGMRQSGVEV